MENAEDWTIFIAWHALMSIKPPPPRGYAGVVWKLKIAASGK